MIRSILVAVILAFTASVSNAQTVTLSGKVKDTTANTLVPQAVVMLLSPKDSIIQGFARTNKAGEYQVEVKAKGNYILMIMHPHFADFVDDISLNQDKNTYNQVPLTPKSKLLEAVIIKSGAPIKIKGDTTVYTADSFKVSANANVEELLKKL
ncbi:MAG TPA: carboxypeptidase regulatory-like domain-containing protein, partial [Ferruginibacter sp.]|nr:carboxypeptidase regulatory-like domain-containing protein [Ferruginibacter sp.]